MEKNKAVMCHIIVSFWEVVMGGCSRESDILKGQSQELLLKVEVMEAYRTTSYYKIKLI